MNQPENLNDMVLMLKERINEHENSIEGASTYDSLYLEGLVDAYSLALEWVKLILSKNPL